MFLVLCYFSLCPNSSQHWRLDPSTASTFQTLPGQLIKVAMMVEANCSLVIWLSSSAILHSLISKQITAERGCVETRAAIKDHRRSQEEEEAG